VQVQRHVKRVGEHPDRRFLAIGAAGEHPQPHPGAALLRQAGGSVVVERRRGFLCRLWQRNPGLHAVQFARSAKIFRSGYG